MATEKIVSKTEKKENEGLISRIMGILIWGFLIFYICAIIYVVFTIGLGPAFIFALPLLAFIFVSLL
ncbi:MAG: hypothetical protein U1C19_07855 [Methanobacteriaceae archaeon]|jgi:hypothetical protein|nr:hypothetical protein [Methanobacteriaceae archaeon]